MASTHKPAAAAAASSTAAGTPSQTLYIKNLDDKLSKAELKRSLYAYLSPYGRILDLVLLSTRKMRGQAFVVFGDVQAAGTALRDCQAKVFMDRPMAIQYARTKSNAVAKLDGTWREQQAVVQREALAQQARNAMVLGKRAREAQGGADQDSDDDDEDDGNEDDNGESNKRQHT
ncbi:hypothetical protein RI367_006663 [Sorochytrium milnesiophthora]